MDDAMRDAIEVFKDRFGNLNLHKVVKETANNFICKYIGWHKFIAS